MEENILQNFMSIGTESVDDAEAIFQLTTEYLNNLKNEKYNAEYCSLLEGLINKIIVISENFDFDQSFINTIEANVINFLNSINHPAKANATLYYNKVFSDTMKFHNLITRIKKKGNTIGPFQPDNCDRPRITYIISEVIEIIRNSAFLTDKAKKNIIERLTQIITELNNEKTDWGVYFKQMGNTIMFISALASIAGGIEAVKNLTTAKEKLEKANKTMETTSLTYSNKDIKEVFVINENPQLEAKVIFAIEQKSTCPIAKSPKLNGSK